ncbi:cation diffusion facilitator family transporter [Alteromonas ponticola]|uniref:Cation diffusion facilitator family transporter n=1 Tax=Alteromonas aquimaris TaxID=2998417 RepID=A0ABT3P8N7_9ALTE|nr:cation diffusion facilitator family transporter [Alteromonas aquimaris]MCW8109135.1 cation diffusion facilitator family transporter [Alteromonas aquimaris]
MGYAFWLNFVFTVIEFVGGWLTNSVAIMADAVHDLGDTLSIGMSWILARLGKQQADDTYTYGFKRLSLFGALINGVILIGGSVWILMESIPRLFNPEMPVTEGMMALAILGVMVNGAAAVKLHGGHTLNEKVLNWHLLEDMFGWIAVLIVAVVLHFYPFPILDPILSIGFTLFILFNVVRHVTQTLKLFLQATPDDAVQQKIKQGLLGIEEIKNLHHLHFWSLDGEHHVLTAHLVTHTDLHPEHLKQLKQSVDTILAAFNLAHTTIEIEMPGEPCRDETPTGH